MTQTYFPIGSMLRFGSELLIPHFSVVNLATVTGFVCTCTCTYRTVLYKIRPDTLNLHLLAPTTVGARINPLGY